MLDALLMAKLFEAAKREGLDLNDPAVQDRLTARKIQIEHMLIEAIEVNTKYCGCKGAVNADSDRRS